MSDPDILTLSTSDSDYPRLLREIADAPETLYCRGDVSLLSSFCFAVVGTRNASDYGLRVAGDIVGALASEGLTIVSGLALGIDGAAHRAALATAGKTIAVLGGGIDDATIAPREHAMLARDIITSGGLLLSEFPPGFPPERWTFPKRNRIISGLSRGVLVIEADRRSGSLITARQALEQNRDVYAVPGSIYWPRSVGTNLIIQEGARPVLCAADILSSYAIRGISTPKSAVSTSDPTQECILALLREHGTLHIDELVSRSGHPSPGIIAAVAYLELRDRIVHTGGGIYLLKE